MPLPARDPFRGPIEHALAAAIGSGGDDAQQLLEKCLLAGGREQLVRRCVPAIRSEWANGFPRGEGIRRKRLQTKSGREQYARAAGAKKEAG